MGILLGLLAALGWGTADYLARGTTRTIGTYRTLLFMQIVGLAGLSLYLGGSGDLVRLARDVGWHAWAWALLVGLINMASSLALYRSFEIGVLAVVAPIAASYAALTVALSLIGGETLGRARGLGIGAALLGVVLVATALTPAARATIGPTPRRWGGMPRGVGWAIAAALGYGVSYWLLGFHVTPELGGVVPVWIIRLTALCTLMLGAWPARQSLRFPQRQTWWPILGIGLLDTGAFLANTIGLATEQVAVVSVLSSLASAVTVVLAWALLRERLAWNQWLGVYTIFAGIVLVSN